MSSTSYSGNRNLQTVINAKNYNDRLAVLVSCFADHALRVLDAGSGIGTFAKILRETKAFDGKDIVCLEPDPDQAVISCDSGLRTEIDIAALEDGSFDYIYSLNVIEHIEDDATAMREWATKLKPGGVMFLYVPAHQFLMSSMDTMVGHYRRYTRKTLTHAVERAGLAIMSPARYADSLGFFVTLVYKFTVKDASLSSISVKLFDAIFPVNRLLDPLFSRLFGKNVWIVAQKPMA